MAEGPLISDDSILAHHCVVSDTSCSAEGYEEELIPLLLRGSDTSGLDRTLYFKISSLPANGELFEETNTNVSLVKGQILKQTESYPYIDGISILYKGREDFFTSPCVNCTHQETFGFAVVTPLDGVIGLGISESVSQIVVVVNVNDIPVITVPTEVQSISTFSSFGWGSQLCGGMIVDESYDTNSGMQCSSVIRINEIIVLDADMNLDYVRVDIQSSNGLLTLNQEYLDMTNFVGCSSRNITGWKCKGSGNSDREMTFVAKPNDLNDIFSGMAFESLIEGDDLINITIYDGIGGNCLSTQEHLEKYRLHDINGIRSFHNACFTVTGVIPVKAVRYEDSDGHAFSKHYPIDLWVSISAGLLLLCVLLIIEARKKWCIIQDQRNHAIEDRSTRLGQQHTNLDQSQLEQRTPISSDHEEVSDKCKEEATNIEHDNEQVIEDMVNAKCCDDEKTEDEWLQHFDHSSGDNYYEHLKTRRVTWTAPLNGGVISSAGEDIAPETSSPNDMDSDSDSQEIQNLAEYNTDEKIQT